MPPRKQRHLCFAVVRSHTTTKNLLYFWGGHRLAFGGDLFPSWQNTVHVGVAWFTDSGITYTHMLSARTRTLAISVVISLCAARFDTACGTSFSSSPRAAGGGCTGWLPPTTGISMPTSTPPPSGWRAHHSTQVCDTTYQVRCLSLFYSFKAHFAHGFENFLWSVISLFLATSALTHENGTASLLPVRPAAPITLSK